MRSGILFVFSAVVIIGALLTIGSTTSLADVPDSINYSGRLDSSSGGPVADGPHTVTFTIYDGAGIPQWSETKPVITAGGLFNTALGSVTPLTPTVLAGPVRFLGITVAGDAEMTPRTALVAVPYAFRTETVDGASGGLVTGDLETTGIENKLRSLYQNYSDLPSPSTYHGMFAHVHGEDAAYYAHAGAWVRLADSGHTHDASGITDEPGISAEATGDIAVAFPFAASVIDSVDITLPAAGYVEVTAGTQLALYHNAAENSEVCFEIGKTSAFFDYAAGVGCPYIPDNANPGVYQFPVTVSRMFAETAGSKRYYFNADYVVGTHPSTHRSFSFIRAKYFPSLYGTAPTANTASGSNAPVTTVGSTQQESKLPTTGELEDRIDALQRELDALRGLITVQAPR